MILEELFIELASILFLVFTANTNDRAQVPKVVPETLLSVVVYILHSFVTYLSDGNYLFTKLVCFTLHELKAKVPVTAKCLSIWIIFYVLCGMDCLLSIHFCF